MLTINDIIYCIVAAIGGILCIILYFYGRHRTAKWFKENAKREEEIENLNAWINEDIDE